MRAIGAKEIVQPFDFAAYQDNDSFLEDQKVHIKDLFQRIGADSREIGVAIGGERVIIKQLPVAIGLDDETISAHLAWEAEKMVVGQLDEFIHEFEKLPFQTPEGNPVYIVTLVRKKVVEGIRSLVEEAGLKLRDLDVDVFSNIRAVVTNYDIDKDDIAVLIDIQRRRIHFHFVREREYFLSHRVSVQEGGSATEFHNIPNIVELLLKEIRRLVFGYRLGRGIDDISRVYLMGNEVVQDISKELSSSFSAPLEIVNPFRRIRLSEAVTQTEEFIHHPERYTTAVGMLLRKVSSLAQ